MERHFISLALFAFLLAGCGFVHAADTLTGGAPTPPAQHHTFSHQLLLLQVPSPYVLPGQILLGPDGNLWFPAVAYENFTTTKPSGAIGRLTPSGKFQMFPIPISHTYPVTLAFGADGKLWFTAFQGNGKLGRNLDSAPYFSDGTGGLGQMNMDGTFHMSTLPSSLLSLHSLVVDTHSNLWFTHANEKQGFATNYMISRMTPSGTFTDFPLQLHDPTDTIHQLIVGPDNNVWFSIEEFRSDNAFGVMGRITPQGSITLFDLGNFVIAQDMTIGKDQTIWFTANNMLNQIAMNGKVHSFDPNAHVKQEAAVSPNGIASAADGTLWFATVNSKIGHFTPRSSSFAFHSFPLSAHFDDAVSTLDMQNLRGIVAGLDGTLWLSNNHMIGHFV